MPPGDEVDSNGVESDAAMCLLSLSLSLMARLAFWRSIEMSDEGFLRLHTDVGLLTSKVAIGRAPRTNNLTQGFSRVAVLRCASHGLGSGSCMHACPFASFEFVKMSSTNIINKALKAH